MNMEKSKLRECGNEKWMGVLRGCEGKRRVGTEDRRPERRDG